MSSRARARDTRRKQNEKRFISAVSRSLAKHVSVDGGVNTRQSGRSPETLRSTLNETLRVVWHPERVGPTAESTTHLVGPAETRSLSRGAEHRSRHLIHHGCARQLRLRVTGAVQRTERNIFRETHRLPGTGGDGDAAGRRHYSGPDRFYDQLGPAEFTIAPSIHKALLTWRSVLRRFGVLWALYA